MKVVLDANQYVSALLKPDGLQFQLLTLARAGQCTLILSPLILEELVRVLSYPKIRKRLPMSLDDVRTFCSELTVVATMVSGTMPVQTDCVDPDDIHYLAAAKEGAADYLISGDHHLLDLERFEITTILTAAAFLKKIAR